MRNEPKNAKERAKTRQEQNRRAAARKAALGLQRISLWIPKEAIEEAERKGLTRIGVIFAEQEAEKKPEVLIKKADGKITPLIYAKTLFEA